ncbi:Nucleolar protein 16 [Ascosphaera atra]|nr:Nucleolar protein 16 [Ascosphaera atra]
MLSADSRDKNLTLAQNYRRLGLSASLNAPRGGVDRRSIVGVIEPPEDCLHDIGGAHTKKASTAADEVQVERDLRTGKILRIVRPEEDEEVEITGWKVKKNNPLNDSLADVLNTPWPGTGTGEKQKSEIVMQLEAQAIIEVAALKHRKPRHMSKREEEWLELLAKKHGDNIIGMVKDKELNPMQQTEGDIRRRVRKWKEAKKMTDK